jgi:hypothetical protein
VELTAALDTNRLSDLFQGDAGLADRETVEHCARLFVHQNSFATYCFMAYPGQAD